MIKIANAQLWVNDQDEALAFYTEKVGMEVRADVTLPEMGGFRWLAVGLPGQADVAIVLMAVPGPPMMDAETAEQVRALMAKGFAGTVFLATEDCQHDLRGAQGPRRRVPRTAGGAPVRHRLRLPRPLRKQHPAGPDPRARRAGSGRLERLDESIAAKAEEGLADRWGASPPQTPLRHT